MQEPFPCIRAHDIAEQAAILSIDGPVGTGRLIVTDPDGEVRRRFDRFVLDHPLAKSGADDREAVFDEQADQGIDTDAIHDEGGAWYIHLRTTVRIGLRVK